MEKSVPPVTELLAHAAWVRALARELVSDPARADDVVQETWLTVLRRPPARVENLRAWLRRAVTNTARTLGRGEGRRRRREEERGRPEALPSTAELVGELEWQRLISAAVLELEEPYLSTVLMRYYRGLEPGEIARVESVPPGTVRSRLKRGLELLRERFDREHGGDRRAWCALLLGGLARGPAPARQAPSSASPAHSGSPGALLSAGLVAGLVLLAGAGLYGLARLAWERSPDGSVPEPVALALDAAREETTEPGGAAVLAATPDVLTPDDPRRTSARASLAATPAAPAFVGRVTAPDGAPIAGAELSIYPNKSRPRPAPIATGTSDADGRFRIPGVPTESAYLMIGAEAEGFGGLTMDPVVPESEIAITLAWVTDVSGVVRDAASGAPVAGVTLRGGAEPAITDADGRYLLRGVRTGHGVSVEARHPSFVKQDQAIFLRTKEPYALDWTLAAGVALSTEVVDRETGRPLVGVPVRESSWSKDLLATTDAMGRFELRALEGLELGAYLELEGYCPTSWRWKVDTLEPVPAPRILVQPLGWIVGSVVNEAGTPLAGASLYATCKARPMMQFELGREEAVAQGVLGVVEYQIEGELATDAEGRFRVPVVPWPAPHGLHVSMNGYVALDAGPYDVSSSAHRPDVELVLARGATLRGRVLENGEPHAYGRVNLLYPSGAFATSCWVGPQGQYEATDVPAGDLRAQVVDDGDRTLMEAVLHFEPGQVVEHDFETTVALAAISGRVLAAPGSTVDGVFVDAKPVGELRARGDLVAVEVDGSFTVHVTPGREYVLCAWLESFGSAEVHAAPGDTDVLLQLPEIGTLQLRLVEQGTGAPARVRNPSQGISTLFRNGSGRDSGVDATLDVHGLLEAKRQVGVHDLWLRFQEDGYVPVEVPGVEVRRIPLPPRTIELVRGAEVEVALEPADAGGEAPHPARSHLVFLLERRQLGSISGPYATQDPPANTRWNGICLRIDDGSIHKQVLELSKGKALVRGLAPGTYVLRAFPDDFAFEPAELEVRGPERMQALVRWRPR